MVDDSWFMYLFKELCDDSIFSTNYALSECQVSAKETVVMSIAKCDEHWWEGVD